MSIRSTLRRAKHYNDEYSKKSYIGLKLIYQKVALHDFLSPADTDAKRRILKRERRIDKAKYAYVLSSEDGKLITVNQLRDLFSDAGLNVDVSLGAPHGAEISAVQNIGKNIFPLHDTFAKLLSSLFKVPVHTFTLQLGASESRFHIRFYHDADGSWIITAHLDWVNVFNIFSPMGLINSHLKSGSGDYEKGCKLVEKLLNHISKGMSEQRVVIIDLSSV